MQNIKYAIYIVFSFFLISCGEDFFESITEIEVPEHEPQLVMRAYFSATYGEEYGYYIRLGHTLGILDTTEYQEVNDATITLYEEGVLKTKFEKTEEDSYWYQAENIGLVEGENYTLKVNSPSYGSIEATQKLPKKIPIISATYEADAAVDRYGNRGDEITLQFQDPAGEKNYYTVSVITTLRFEGPDTSFVSHNWTAGFVSPVDPLLEDFNQLYLTDASFDGETYTTRFSLDLFKAGTIEIGGAKNLTPEKLNVRLASISKDWYLFQKTLFAFRENKDNPFAEPVVIHGNVEGGSGIFLLSITDEFEIDL